jgi:hypothetical protein
MSSHITRLLGFAAAGLLLAASAEAQGRGGRGHGAEHAAKHRAVQPARRHDGVIRDRDRDRDRDDYYDRYRDRSIYGNGRKIPPGLAKKPGQMPPGQYKKYYGARQGADVLSDILRRRGYPVTRILPSGDSRYVYYRLHDGAERRAMVRPGRDRLLFQNVPSSLLQEVLSRLY